MQLIRPARAWLAAALIGLGCGNDPVTLSVVFDVDAPSCNVPGGDLELLCSGTVVVQVTTAAGTESSCAHFDAGSFDAVGGALTAAVDLGALPTDEAITLSMSFYDTGPGITSCPPVASAFAFLTGSIGPARLPRGSQPLELSLECTSGDTTCTDCDSELLFCADQGGVASCDEVATTCTSRCGNFPDDAQSCASLCTQLATEQCTGPGGSPFIPNLDCEGFASWCPISCEGQSCSACTQVETICNDLQKILDGCTTGYQRCSDPGCVPQGSCVGPSGPLPLPL